MSTAAATLSELEQALPGASSDFVMGQLRTGATVAQAQTALISQQRTRIGELETENSRLKGSSGNRRASSHAAQSEAGGFASQSQENGGSAKQRFESSVKGFMDEGMTRLRATAKVVKDDPDLHAAYIEEANAGRRQRV